jgi:hypothetical protein
LSVSKRAPSFTVTTASEKVTLDKSGAARVPFVVTNTSAQALQGQLYAQPLGGAKPEWFTVVGESIRDFAPGEVQQVVVELKVPPVPPGTPTASYSFRLDAVSEENPDEDFTEGQSVAFDVKAPPPPPKKKKFPWWILAIVGAVVLLIIIGVVLWLLLRDTGTTVPRVVGEQRAAAENKLTDAGFAVKAQFVQVDDREQHGLVQSQVPEGGTKQKKKTEVTISVGRMPALTWSSLSLLNGWANYTSANFGPPGLQYMKDQEGFVHLRGTLTGRSATENLVATLPSGFRPPSGAWVAVGESNGSFNPFPENAWIDSSGNIRLLPGTGANNSFVSLEGVEFYVG